MKRITERTRNDTRVVKKDIHHLIAKRLKKMKTMKTRAQGVSVVEQV